MQMPHQHHLFYAYILVFFYNSSVACAPTQNPSCDSTCEATNGKDEIAPESSDQGRMEINPELEYADSKVVLTTEGDILQWQQFYRNAVNVKWPGKDGNVSVPYVISKEVEYKAEAIQEAMAMITAKSCVSFHKREEEEHFLMFKPGTGCASYIGFKGGEQPILIASRCRTGNICHEILHALGFYHEQSRMDRDKYIKILLENVRHGKEKNFKKVDANTQDLPYDLTSILHYGSSFFSSNGKPTIVPKQSGVRIGQRSYLSKIDVQRLQKFYNCGVQTSKGQNATGHL